MDWLSNEMILYIGIGLTVGSLLLSATYFSFSKNKKIQLEAQMEKEFGEDETKIQGKKR